MEIFSLLFAVVIGVLLVLVIRSNTKFVRLLLAFSGAYLLSITLLKFLPEVYDRGGEHIGVFILLGLVIQLVLDFFSKGAEHGHIHPTNSRYFIGTLFISLNIHAFMEGLPLSGHQHHPLLWAIVVHKIPIAMVLTGFLLHLKIKRLWAVLFLLFFAVMTPLGTFLGDKIPFLLTYNNEINAVVAGIFLHIATIILFEAITEHRFHLLKFSMMLLGIVVALVFYLF